MKKILSVLVLFSLFVNVSLFAQKFEGWKKAETKHFNFIYENTSKIFADEYAKYADEAWNKISQIYDFPQEKTNVFITDRTNTVNAYTYSVPLDIVMFTSPVITPEFGFRENWQKLFFTHELIHVANMRFTGEQQFLSKLIGPYIDTFNLADTPNWALEGLATVLETQLTNGGRGRSPYFEMLYKAPTIHNGFISFNDIGLENEPPRGQSYVMGYLILQSIVDRWGINALSDIERNHAKGKDWNYCIKLVTGKTAEEIYNDVRISLAKKYHKEMEISEGIIISPRKTNTYYYNPAIVFDDGSFIALRKSPFTIPAVVKFDPSAISGSNWYIDTNPDENLNTVYEETVLFTGAFADSTSVTADENGTVYASLMIERMDRYPGYESEYAIYKFTEESGLTQLTHNKSFFQPTVSRDGKTLFAITQNGLKMEIVSIDTETGDFTTVLKSENSNFIQPSLNNDGTKLTFIETNDQRAKVCVLDLKDQTKTYKIVANDKGTITDPAYPHWNSDGKLTYASNDRGRLEVYEVNDSKNEFVSVPVVSDPIAALWAYKTSKGILYSSYASTGNVIKMKPLNEWGKVPSFEGPSKPGTIISFGNLYSDYPDFEPFQKPSEIEITLEDLEKYKLDLVKKEDPTKPIPVKGKIVEHRSEESTNKAKNLPEPQTFLSNEKNYFPFISPILYIPTISFQEIPEDDSSKFGFGYSLLAETPRLQMNNGGIIANFEYFPGMNNFEFLFAGLIPIGDTTFAFYLNRDFVINEISGTKTITESNSLLLGYTDPIYHRLNHYNETDIKLIASIKGDIYRTSDKSFSVTDNIPVNYSLSGQLGLDCSFTTEKLRDETNKFSIGAFGIGLYDFDLNKFFAGFESLATFTISSGSVYNDIQIGLRYTDFPVLRNNYLSRVKISGIEDNNIWPGKILLNYSYVLPQFILGLDGKAYFETEINFGKNTVDFSTPISGYPLNLSMPSCLFLGGELEMDLGQIKLNAGTNIPFSFNAMSFGKWNFYFNCKMDWWRN